MLNPKATAKAAFVVVAILVTTLTMSFRSQTANQVRWTNQISKLGNGEAEIKITGNIPAGWHIYSQSMEGSNGPLPTTIEFEPASGEFQLEGKTNEMGKLTTVYEPTFEMDVNYYEGTVTFKQRIKYKDGSPVALRAVISYMMCNASECMPPTDEEMTITID